MVRAIPGSLLTCSDAATLQFVKYLNEEGRLGKFILLELDDTHVFVDSSKVKRILKEIDDFSDRNAYDADQSVENKKDSKRRSKS